MPHPTTATFVRDLPPPPAGSAQKLWRLDHPIPYRKRLQDPATGSIFSSTKKVEGTNVPALYGHEDGVTSYIISSHARSAMLLAVQGEGEVYLFATDKDGTVLDWSELPGSQKGDVPHQTVIDAFLASFQE